MIVRQGSLLRLPGVTIWAIFEFLGGMVIYSAYQVKRTARFKSYRHLGVYPSKVFSTGGTVSTIPWPPMAPITAPGGRDLDDF